MSLAGHYQRLVALQDLDGDTVRQTHKDAIKGSAGAGAASAVATSLIMDSQKLSSVKPSEVKALEHEHARKARRLSKGDEGYLLLGAIGAILAGCRFPVALHCRYPLLSLFSSNHDSSCCFVPPFVSDVSRLWVRVCLHGEWRE